MKRFLVIGLIVALLLCATVSTTLAVVYYFQSVALKQELDKLQGNSMNITTTATIVPSATSVATSTVAPTSAADCVNQSSSGNIVVNLPCKNQVIASPLNIKGKARVFENTFSVEIYDGANVLLKKEVIVYTAPDAGQFGNFAAPIAFTAPAAGTTGKIKFYSSSAKDGTLIDVVEFAVKF